MSRQTAQAGRMVAYAMKFINDSTDYCDPTDENLERVLSGCVRPARPEEYEKIRAEVQAWTEYGLTAAELEELEDATPAWLISRGDLNRIAGRKLTDEEVARAVKSIDCSDARETATDAAAAALR